MKKTLLLFTAIMSFALMAHPAPSFKFFASFGPPHNAGSYASYTAGAVAMIVATDTLPKGQRTSPTDARLINSILPEYLMTTVSLPFYWDSFTPVSPWDNERGGTIWCWEEIIAAPGQPIALSDVTGTITSSDSGNVLGKTYSFTSDSYSPTAIGINSDGSQVTSGPATQTVTGRVIFGVGYKSFPVGTSNDVVAVKNFIYQFNKWSTTNVVTVQGTSATLVLSTQPSILTASAVSGKFKITAAASDDPKSYALQSSTNLTSGIWSPAGSIQAGQTIDLGPFIWPHFFVRYAP